MGNQGGPRARLQTRFQEIFASFSPDGRWLAYMSNESGRYEIYVAPTHGTRTGLRISRNGGSIPHWREDGRELFFLSDDDEEIVAVPMDLRDDTVVPGPPESLFALESGGAWAYDVTADGQRFLVTARDNASHSLHVILSWEALLSGDAR